MTMASGLYGVTWRDILDSTGLDVDIDNDNFKMPLLKDAHTPDFDADSVYADLDNEVSGTGYTAGGQTMSGESITAASGKLTIDATDTQWTDATISSIRGRAVTDDSLSGDPLILATTFGADYSVTSGTLTVQENALGLAYITYAA